MFKQKRVAVDDTRDLLFDGNEGSEALVTNRDATDSVFLGDVTVTASGAGTDGYELKPGETIGVSIGSRDDDLYGICSAGLAAPVHVLLH